MAVLAEIRSLLVDQDSVWLGMSVAVELTELDTLLEGLASA